MPTTFAQTIDGNYIYAQRAVQDKDGNAIDQTYAKSASLATVATSGSYADLSNKPTINNVPTVTSSDDAKVLKASYTGGVGSYSWEAESGGGVTDVEVDGVSAVSQGVASITMPTVDQTYNSASTNAQAGVAVASALLGKQDTLTAGSNITISSNTISATDTTYSAGTGIVVDNVNHTITFDVGQWEDVATEAQYNTDAVNAGSFQIKYNALLKLLSVSCDVNLKAGDLKIFTWSNRLKPVATQFALGNGLSLYVSQTTLNQPSSAASRWVNGVWMWPVVGGSN